MSTIALLLALAGFAFVLVCVAAVSPRFTQDQHHDDEDQQQ